MSFVDFSQLFVQSMSFVDFRRFEQRLMAFYCWFRWRATKKYAGGSDWLEIYSSSPSRNQWTKPLPKTLFKPGAPPHHNCLFPSVFNTTWKLFLVALAVADFLDQPRMCVHIKSLCVPIGNVVCSHKKYVCAHWAHHIVCSHKEPLYFSEMNIRFSLNYFLFLSRSESRFSCGKKTIALDILLFSALTGLAGFVAAYI